MTKISHRLALEILNLINVDINLYIENNGGYTKIKLSDCCHYIEFDEPVYDGEYDYIDEVPTVSLYHYNIYMDKELDENGRVIL